MREGLGLVRGDTRWNHRVEGRFAQGPDPVLPDIIPAVPVAPCGTRLFLSSDTNTGYAHVSRMPIDQSNADRPNARKCSGFFRLKIGKSKYLFRETALDCALEYAREFGPYPQDSRRRAPPGLPAWDRFTGRWATPAALAGRSAEEEEELRGAFRALAPGQAADTSQPGPSKDALLQRRRRAVSRGDTAALALVEADLAALDAPQGLAAPDAAASDPGTSALTDPGVTALMVVGSAERATRSAAARQRQAGASSQSDSRRVRARLRRPACAADEHAEVLHVTAVREAGETSGGAVAAIGPPLATVAPPGTMPVVVAASQAQRGAAERRDEARGCETPIASDWGAPSGLVWGDDVAPMRRSTPTRTYAAELVTTDGTAEGVEPVTAAVASCVAVVVEVMRVVATIAGAPAAGSGLGDAVPPSAEACVADLLRVLSWETGAECRTAQAVVKLVRFDWEDPSDEADDDWSGAAQRASSILLLLRIITFVIHASGSVAGGMLELLDAQAEVGDSDLQTGGSAMRAVGSLVGNRECDYAADVVRLLALEAPSCSSFAEVEEALTCVPEVSSRLVSVLHQAERDLERVRASGQLTTLADEEEPDSGVVEM